MQTTCLHVISHMSYVIYYIKSTNQRLTKDNTSACGTCWSLFFNKKIQNNSKSDSSQQRLSSRLSKNKYKYKSGDDI